MFAEPVRYVEGLPRPGRCLVMGVLNVTPDSFHDGGVWLDPDRAVSHGLDLRANGADLVDVGGESTRPGAERPAEAEELRRVIPVIERLAAAGVTVSVDTMRATVAEAALAAGATVVNDVSGGRADPGMLPLVAAAGVPYMCMHWRGHSADMQRQATYDDVVGEVLKELGDRVAGALAAGVAPERLAVDPGIGFAKEAEHNWRLLRDLTRLHALGYPLLVGASSKSFLGALLADQRTGAPRPVGERRAASIAVDTLSALAGVWCVRTHDVAGSADAVRVASRWAAADSASSDVPGTVLPGMRPDGPDGRNSMTVKARADRLSLVGIRATGHHGVAAAEREAGQEFTVDVVLGIDTGAAAATDDLDRTVDYSGLVSDVRDAVVNGPVNLIETLAERIADRCLQEAPASWAEVTVHKPHAPLDAEVDDITVTIHRSRT